MNIETITKRAFSVLGKEGSTEDGPGFVRKLWADANAHFGEVQPLAKTDGNGNLVTADAFLGKTIDVRGIVDYFKGTYQIKVFSVNDITIHN